MGSGFFVLTNCRHFAGNEEANLNFIELFHRGGPLLYPLFLCSFVAVTIFLERLWSLRKKKVIPKGFIEKLAQYVSVGKIEEALAVCDQNRRSTLARVARAGLIQIGESPEMIRFMIGEIGGQEAVGLEKNQRILATIAYIAPLLGLLGTVSGMIKAFEVISHQSVGDPALLAGGISEALITTAAGLVIAIPVVIMHKIVQGRADNLSLELEKESVTLTEHLIKFTQKKQEENLEVKHNNPKARSI